jgi:hypothetical protein
MVGSDFPFDMGAAAPRAVVEAQTLSPADRARIDRGTAAEFLGLAG